MRTTLVPTPLDLSHDLEEQHRPERLKIRSQGTTTSTSRTIAKYHFVPPRRSLSMFVIAFVSPLFMTTLSQAAVAPPAIGDRKITFVIESGLNFDRGVTANGIDVTTSNGIVTLSGTVDNLLARERAVKVAESVRGVRGVIDRTSVTIVPRLDDDVRKAILRSLLQDPATEAYQVAVSVKQGDVTLTGSVGSHAAQELAERTAKGMRGVRRVANDVTIVYLQKRTDDEIAADVKARLQWDIWLNGDVLKAAVKDGKVTVSGRVGSAIGKSRAFDDAWVNGVRLVDDSAVTVDPHVRDEAHQSLKFVVRSDADIRSAVQAELHLDPRVAAFNPNVTVEDGGVILSGSVGNLKAKTAAEQDVHNIVGVWRVDNFLKVRLNGPFVDSEMEKELKIALSWDASLDSSRIDVAIINRIVYLSGAVDSSLQRFDAEDVASRIKGVLWVQSHIKIEPDQTIVYEGVSSYYDWPYYEGPHYELARNFAFAPVLTDEQIKKDIEDAFFWSPFVIRKDVVLSVHGGVATLTGSVGSWIAWREADGDARKSAAYVLNRLTVKRGAWW